MGEDCLNSRAFAAIISVILIIQPFIIISGMMYHSTVSDLRNDRFLAQVPGTRLTPDEHVNHVPILIDGTDDFISQGWPGEGTAGNPYVITGLNITYNHLDPLVSITNTDAYFVIRDCYIKQLASTIAVYFNSTTHAKIEYSTVVAAWMGIYFDYAENTVIDHVDVRAESYRGLFMEYSDFSVISNNFLYSGSQRALMINYCDLVEVSGNTAESDNDGNHCVVISFSNNVSVIDHTSIHGIGSFIIQYSNYSEFIGGYIESYSEGLHAFQCRDLTISDVEINATEDGHGAIIHYSHNLNVNGLSIRAPNDYGVMINHCNNSQFENIALGQIGGIALQADNCYDSNFTGCTVQTANSYGMLFQHGENLRIVGGDISDTYAEGIYLEDIEWATIADNVIQDLSGEGIKAASTSHNGMIEGNQILNEGETGIIISGENWTVQDNVIEANIGIISDTGGYIEVLRNEILTGASIGIQLSYREDALVVNNTIGEATANSLYVLYGHRSIINGNILNGGYDGLRIRQSENVTAIGNEVNDFTYRSIDVHYSDGLIANNNTIVDSEYLGFYITHTERATFHYNTFLESSFLFETIQTIAEMNHSILGNYVNGLPVYYAFDETGQSIDGTLYGQIMIVNCSDMAVTGGYFNDQSQAFTVRHSENVVIDGLEMVDIRVGNIVEYSDEISISDCTIEGVTKFRSIIFQHCENVTATNINATYIDDTGSGAVFSAHFTVSLDIIDCNFYNTKEPISAIWGSNLSVIDCTFLNVEGYAIYSNVNPYPVVQGCSIDNATYGFMLGGSQHAVVTQNDIRHTTYAIHSTGGTDSYNATVTLNHLQDNVYGIMLKYADNWIITNNTILWSSNMGIHISNLANVAQISYNTIALSGVNNGYDSVGQYWDDNVDTGNIWGDFTGTAPYIIPGGAGSQDRYPITFEITEPIINDPIDIYYAEGSTGNYIVWLPYDNSLRNWEIEMDGSYWAGASWNYNNINVSIDGLVYGTHTAIVTVWDIDQNTVSDTVLIYVYDDTPPEIDSPANQWLFIDVIGQTVDWEISDLHPGIYTLLVDEVEFDTGTWTSGMLSLDVDDIDEGEHTLVLIVYDIDGNSVSDVVLVRVIDDNDNPTIEDAEDVVYIEGTTGNVLDWTADDDYPATYAISLNGTLVKEGNWGGARIVFDVDGLAVGIYEFTLTVYDMSGNHATSSANVTVIPVVPVEPPVIFDWILFIIIGAVCGGIIVAVVIMYYLRKKPSA